MSIQKDVMPDTKGLYLYVTPVTGVFLGKSTRGEYRIDKVTLYSMRHFLRIRRYKFALNNWRKEAANCEALKGDPVVATVSAGGDYDTARRYGHRIIKEELNILSSSRLGYTSRDRRGFVGIKGCLDSYNTEDILLGLSIGRMQSSSHRHAIDGVRITNEFLKMPDAFFPYRRLLWLIRGNGNINDKWRHILRNVAILAGRSQNSIEIADAFLWNMIALEQLILGEDEKAGHLDMLVSRCKALFGYCPLWERRDLGNLLKLLYELRCSLVHEGDRDGITIGHLIMADLILSNVIGNLVFNSSIIESKGSFIDFAEKAKARVLLGKDARGKGWHWHFSNLHYSEEQLNKFWAL